MKIKGAKIYNQSQLYMRRNIRLPSLILLLFFSIIAVAQKKQPLNNKSEDQLNKKKINMEKATFGGGCFWCVEAVFQDLEGVQSVESGYAGGHVDNPTYKQVCTGNTGHAEVIQITYDPGKLNYEELLEVFWMTHDPTTLNRQGHDEGTQYRSVIFYHNEQQRLLAEKYKKKLEESKAFDKPIVTQISPYKNYYKAEDYHQNYYKLNGSQPYCAAVIRPKVDKFKKVFKDKLKKTSMQ